MDLADAIHASENNTITFAEVPRTGVIVRRGPTLDGLGDYYRQTISESDAEPIDVVAALREAEVDVLVSYLPVGSELADAFYAQCAIDAGVGFVNALPVFIASDPMWAAKFAAAGVPIVGDDIKSQVGATITHRVLAKLFEDRGVRLERTYQLNFGGNMDFQNMLERSRLHSKKISKTQAVTSQIPHEMRRCRCAHRPQRLRSLSLPTASMRWCAWKDEASATCRYIWSTNSRSGIRPTRQGSSSTRSGHARSPMDRGIGRSGVERQLLLHEESAGAIRRLHRAGTGGGFHQGLRNTCLFPPPPESPCNAVTPAAALASSNLHHDEVRQRKALFLATPTRPLVAALRCPQAGRHLIQRFGGGGGGGGSAGVLARQGVRHSAASHPSMM